MHRLLKRQIKKFLGKSVEFDDLDENLKAFLNQISEVYDNFDEQRRIHDHIITVNSEELRNSNEQLKELLKERSELLENKTNENKDIINILHQYREAIDKSLIVSRTDIDGKITYANDNFCKVSGYSREELIGKSHSIVKNPDNPSNLYSEMWNTITNKKIWQGTFSNKNKYGEVYYVKSTIIPLLDRNGNLKEYIALRDDITQQVLYQEKLKQQRKRIKTIFNSQEDITIIVKPNVGIVDVNQKFYDRFEFKTLEDFKENASCVCDLFNERIALKKSLNENEEWYEKFVDNRSDSNIITRINSQGNDEIYRIYCKNIELEGLEHFLITFVDVTELEKARRKAEIAKEAKSQFLANMSHEIRTPLNAIIGFSDILKTRDLGVEEKNYASIISKSAESLLDIINDVLDISKIESGKLDIEEEAFPINVLIENIVELFSVKAKEKNIRFVYDADPNVPFSIYTDSTRLRQVISNLLSNAIKFTHQNGTVVFSMKVLNKSQTDVSLEFSIKDNGIGINKEQQKIIFEPFSQGDSGITREFGGTGLGLSICRDIVNLLGSEISLESEVDIGTTFKFTLDLKIDKQNDERDHHFNEVTFAVSNINKDDEHLRESVINYITKIGRVFDFDENSILNNIDIIFCFDNSNLTKTIENFLKLNRNAKIIYVGERKAIKDLDIVSHITNYIDLPIYGSKIFNIISDHAIFEEKTSKPQKIEKAKENLDKHILVAEDNLNNQMLIQILLEELNINCTIANNGQEAIELYEENRYDLVLMDINMPILDGVSATKEIIRKQQEEGLYKIPIVALTANSLEGDREKYIYAGMDDYISKPIIFDKLKDVIKKHTFINSFSKKEETIDTQVKEEKTISTSFDKKNIINQLNVSDTIVDMLLNKFFSTIHDDIDELENFIKEKDFEQIKEKAHYLKGSCLNLTMTEIADILKNIEDEAKNKKCNLNQIEEIKALLILIKELS